MTPHPTRHLPPLLVPHPTWKMRPSAVPRWATVTSPRAVTKMEVRRTPARCLLNRSTLWEAAGMRVGWSQQLVLATGAERFTCSQVRDGRLEASLGTSTTHALAGGHQLQPRGILGSARLPKLPSRL